MKGTALILLVFFSFGCASQSFDLAVWKSSKPGDEVRCEMVRDLESKLKHATKEQIREWFPESNDVIEVGTCSGFVSFVGTGYYFFKIEFDKETVKSVVLSKS